MSKITDIFLDVELPPFPIKNGVIVQKSDYSGYFWHCLCRNDEDADVLKGLCKDVDRAYIIKDKKDALKKVPENMKIDDETPLHVFEGKIHYHDDT
jgi:hypothetical protein